MVTSSGLPKPCEICFKTWDGQNKDIAGHTLCEYCLKKLKIPKEKTLAQWEIRHNEETIRLNLNEDFKDIFINARQEHWKRIIYYDLVLHRFAEMKK